MQGCRDSKGYSQLRSLRQLRCLGLLDGGLFDLPASLASLKNLSALTLMHIRTKRGVAPMTGWHHLLALTQLRQLALYPRAPAGRELPVPSELAPLQQAGMTVRVVDQGPWPAWSGF